MYIFKNNNNNNLKSELRAKYHFKHEGVFPGGTYAPEEGHREGDSTNNTEDHEGVQNKVHSVRDHLPIVRQLPRTHTNGGHPRQL